MTEYDALFAETAPDGRIFADKAALDPLAEPETVMAREEQQTRLAEFLNGVHHAYLPTTIAVYGPPGTGKTLTARRVCREFAARTDCFAFEYVNLKECRTLFSAGNEILLEVAGEKLKTYQGLDGIFDRLWDTLESYPEYTVVIFDEIDHIKQDSNYDPSEFFYRLLRGDGKLRRDLNLSLILISNELVDIKLRLDSRVKSAMDGEKVLFPPYGINELTQILTPQLEQAFHLGALSDPVRAFGIREAARKWGDARKALRLFRKSGETAVERDLDGVTKACISTNLHTTERDATVEKLLGLPFNHFHVLAGMTSVFESSGAEIKQPVTTSEIVETLDSEPFAEEFRLGERAVRDVVTELETMGLVETWIDSRGR
jgi:cell division control protein 6